MPSRWRLTASCRALYAPFCICKHEGGEAIANNSNIAATRDRKSELLYSAAKAAMAHDSKLAGFALALFAYASKQFYLKRSQH